MRATFPAYLLALLLGVIVTVVLIIAIPEGPTTHETGWETIDETTSGSARLAPPEPPSGEWRISATRRSSLATHELRVQVVDGRPVIGSWGVVHDLTDGRRRVRGRVTSARAPRERRGALSGADAVTRAVASLDGAELRDEPDVEAAFLADGLTLVPVWRVTVRTWEPLGDWQFVIDEAGEVRSSDNIVCIAARGDVFTARPDVPCGEGVGASDEALAPFVTDEALRDLLVGGYLDGSRVRVSDSSAPRAHRPDGVFEYPPSAPEFEQVMCYATLTGTLAHLDDIGVSGYDAATFEADARGYPGDNSFFSPTTGTMTFGRGGIPDAQDRDIINHELGHALHHYAQPGYATTPSSRAVSEGLSDYLAASVADDPRVGDWDADAYSPACPPYLRRVDVARRFPDDMTGRVHDDGLILATALWHIRGEIGAAVTDRVLMESLFFLAPDADLHSAAATFLATARLMEGDAYEAEIANTFAQWGLGEGGSATIGPEILVRATPNPFRERATIRYVLPAAGAVRVDIVDVSGRLITNLLESHQSAGSHSVTWDGRRHGRPMAPGVYFYCVASEETFASGKIVLTR